MPSALESGKLQLSAEEIRRYRAATDRLALACDAIVDLRKPIALDEWVLLVIADAALRGDRKPLDRVIATIEAEIESRRQRN